jgi:hypothetical protein
MTAKCTWEGCPATTERPALDGWTYLSDYGPGIKDGIYCPAHAAAIEAVRSEGGLDEPENDAG